MSSKNWLTSSLVEGGHTEPDSLLDAADRANDPLYKQAETNDLPNLPQRIKGATLLKPGEQYLLDGTLLVEVTVVSATEVEYRAVNDADAIALGWGKTSGGYEAISDIDDFLPRAEAVDAPVPYLPPVSLDDSHAAPSDDAAPTALGDTLRRLADMADAGTIRGRDHQLDIHFDDEGEVRALAALLGADVDEYQSHTDTVQVSFRSRLDGVRVVAMTRTDRPWVEVTR
ncbi:hypothetical protein [Promicromonospora iranensis]|uniref:Halobacterial output domain-containing protein n=1 Tax=Promicromonospora iranensis TaxID=1105144 RepID=A0ABU2CV90_9MICO|nr:hypothetical protein [Promicromonospora iranensis]MDR7385252.1 hypothetical protein [Promicromonospora iranensis]